MNEDFTLYLRENIPGCDTKIIVQQFCCGKQSHVMTTIGNLCFEIRNYATREGYLITACRNGKVCDVSNADNKEHLVKKIKELLFINS